MTDVALDFELLERSPARIPTLAGRDHAGARPVEGTTADGLMVTVVVPCKNDARYLTANLESILSQDYPYLECIVVDGGSTDVTVDLLKRYGDRIRWISEPDRGAFDAINRGWQLARGEILTWLNADDLWEPGAVRAAVEAFQRQPDVDVVYGTAAVVDELGRARGEMVPRAWDLEYALRNCDHIIFQPASFMRRRILEQVGWLYPAWCHDHDLWLRIARAGGTFARIPNRLAVDRLRMENHGYLAAIVVPGKIGLTKRFFAEPVPPHVNRLRRRAISNAYVRALDYLRGNRVGNWLWAVWLLTRAVVADPQNLPAIAERGLRPVRARGSAFLARSRKLLRAIRRSFVRLVSFLFTVSRRWLRRMVERVFTVPKRRLGRRVDRVFTVCKQLPGRMVERVFTRANRSLVRNVERLGKRQAKLANTLQLVQRRQEKRVRGLEQAVPLALQPVSTQVGSLAATIQQLADGLARDHHWVRGAVDTLRDEQARRSDALEQAFLQTLIPHTARIDSVAALTQQLADGLARDHHWVRGAVATLREEQAKKADALEQAVLQVLIPHGARIDAVAAAAQQLARDIERERQSVQSALDSLRHEHEARADALEQAIPSALVPFTARIDALAVDVLRLDAKADALEPAVVKAMPPLIEEGLRALRHQHDVLRGEVTAALERPPAVLTESGDVYGTPPALRPIPGWVFGWGVDRDAVPFLQDRQRLWASLTRPVILRWFADLRVMIWPGNESSRTLFLTGTFEPNELMWVSQVLTEGMTFLDVGANLGVYSMFASKLVGASGTVVALEPSARDFQRLAFHVTLNNLENVRPLRIAASDESTRVLLKVAQDRNSGHNTFGAFAYAGVECLREELVDTRPLDAVVAEQGLDRVDLVKIDVEGHELRVLAGLAETLARFRPKVLIEVFDQALRKQGTCAAAVLAFLERQGYTLHEFSEATGEPVPLSQFREDQIGNLVALPS